MSTANSTSNSTALPEHGVINESLSIGIIIISVVILLEAVVVAIVVKKNSK